MIFPQKEEKPTLNLLKIIWNLLQRKELKYLQQKLMNK
jgi:hypothetical protein